MQILARHPIEPNICMSHLGRPVVAIMQNGDSVCGIMERVHDGHLVLRPIAGTPPVAVYNVKMRKNLRSLKRNIATTKAYGPGGWGRPYGFGRPYGWGYGNYGWGLGWWWVFPLFWLAAIAAFAFAW